MPNPTSSDAQNDASKPVSSTDKNAVSAPSGEASLAPQAGDERLARGPVFIDGQELLIAESYPVQVSLVLTGSLPTPCHQLRVVAPTQANTRNELRLEVYSLADPDKMCSQVLVPFEVKVPLGSHAGGTFSVWVNEDQIGEFAA